MTSLRLIAPLLALAAGVGAGEPRTTPGIVPPVPLVAAVGSGAGAEPGLTLAAARRAQDLGLPSVAADLYRRLRTADAPDPDGLTLALATALIDAGRAEEALTVLEEYRGARGSAWQLRAGLAASHLRRLDAARAAVAAVREADLPAGDRAWWWFLQGELADLARAGEFARANEFYRRAEEAAPNDLARARFQLAAESLRLRLGTPREADLKAMRENYERQQGSALGYGFAQTYAVALDILGQKGQAVTFLQGVLVGLPRAERVWWDKLRLVLGLIGDKTRTGAGRNALGQLLESGHDPLRQRQALQLLAAESGAEPERAQFRALLNRLLDARPDHPIKESLLYFRAQLALLEREFATAEEDANVLLRQFPLSPLRVHALGVLTQSAWEQRRYRLAADFAQRTRAELRAQGPAREGEAALALLEAEAWFRAGLASGDRADYRGAAAAYAAVVRARTAEIPAERWGGLMLQRILAEIRAGSGEAGRVLDELAADAAFDAENRWRAEWSLARALLPEGAAGVREAYGRVNRLLSVAPPAGLPGELRARMAWLQARLAFDSGELERAVELSGALLVAPELPAALRTELTSTAALLRGRAEFALGREPAALETLRRLRAEHPGSEAAASSFLTEAEHFADQDKIDEARNRLISLTDNPAYRTSDYVPFALFRLATLAERLGRPENLQEANKRIEELVASPAGATQPDLVFAARLRQGNIFRKLNDFPAAQRAYEDLVNRYPRRPDVVLAQLALADTHSAQSSAGDTSHADAAQLLFEQLRDRVDAPRDVRVEAGHKLGLLLARRGRVEEAIAVWWRDVIQPNLREEAGPFEPGATRPYWLARTLRELGEALERLGRTDEARRAYELLLDQRLPAGESIARARLEQLGGGARR